MRITNGTPLLVAPVAARHPQSNRPSMTVALKGSFRLADGVGLEPLEEPLLFSGDVFQDDDPGGECLQASDFAWWKPRADLLLRGTCHVPDGKPAGVCAVRFAVGNWSKTLAVYGPRTWSSSGDSPGVAAPFTAFPLSYRASFGGVGRPENPVGVGMESAALPRIESAQVAMKTRADTPPPAGFGPLNPTWLPRQAKLGTYTDGYRKERWPGFPADFDWSFFNAAPEDQQVPYLAGNESVILENLVADKPRLRTRLPGWRVRCVIQQLEGNEVKVKELPMVLDTLTVDADAATVSLVWRGLVDVQDEEMEDVLEIFVMAESLDEPAKPTVALLSYLSPALPLVAAALALRPRAAAGADGAASPAGAAAAAGAAPKPGATAAAPPTPGAPGGPPAAESPTEASGKPDAGAPQEFPPKPEVAELFALHGAELEKTRQTAEDAFARLEEQLALHPDKLPWAGFPDTPAPPATSGYDAMAETWKASKSSGRAPDAAGDELMDMRVAMEGIDNIRDFVARQPPPREAPKPPTAEEVRKRIADPDAPTAQEMSGADLAGEDFSEADLTGSVARDAELAGMRGDTGTFKAVVFAGSDMKGASFRGADLSQADLTGCDLSGADLTGANLQWAILSGSTLCGAKLDRVTADHATFVGADLTDASLVGADLRNADLSDSNLDGVKAEKANLTEATLHGCHGARASFVDADLTRLRAGERVRLTRSRFTGAKGAGAIWQAADLTGSDFTKSLMPGAMFDKALLTDCRFDGSDLAGARFRKATLLRATLKRANLFRGTMARADLTEADFSAANMFGVDFMEATLGKTLFEGTNLKQTTLAEA